MSHNFPQSTSTPYPDAVVHARSLRGGELTTIASLGHAIGLRSIGMSVTGRHAGHGNGRVGGCAALRERDVQ